jgi:hypothetical protein
MHSISWIVGYGVTVIVGWWLKIEKYQKQRAAAAAFPESGFRSSKTQ